MARIDYFFSVFSPWSYLAGLRLEEIAARHGASITYKPVDLLAMFAATGGTAPAQRPACRMEYRMQELKRWSDRLGMEMVFQPANYPPNPAPASYAVIAAQKAGGGDIGGLVHAILRAVWVEQRDIASDEVLREKLEANGFDGNLVTTGLFDGAITYERNLEEAKERGAFGSPFYIVAETDERFFGQDRLEFLDAHLGTL
ncbi:2-hydroxychromene-2-carboxylate isomerase [Thioclava sp. BHET1]|uniref:2-hydroxychromene-2-carboxylate isomerase n=1 Tax=Thioclava dalianensis TaxID=1185766 RepID=A0A074TN70_9RHOB|nr:2-hydroxychromene-2-carboxylate isomerase [Thioclava dalianensis]KEP71610.1 2-hydroxychromene-2-carboxylate isomerase [Thioclava dalianensis]TMV87778.1 2-hydroxychromene-2-carboxylate isomerase [Thioclava sp. BHET1]SFN43239.1 2-hydroxychromene-2-carboxylate isomerase [Thioclava dalianensis]